jgi:hypothetical protein
MATRIIPGGASASDTPVAQRLEIELDQMSEKRATVRFDSMTEAEPPVKSFYLRKAEWEKIGSPAGVLLTVEPL